LPAQLLLMIFWTAPAAIATLPNPSPRRLHCTASLSSLIILPEGFGSVLSGEELRRKGCFPPVVAMVQATDARFPDDLGLR